MISSFCLSVPRHQLLATSSRRSRAARRRTAAGAFRLHTSYFPLLALSSFIVLTFSFLLHAAPPKEALLIANGKYSHFAGLANPSPDAAKLSAALEQLGFRVRVVHDGNREQILVLYQTLNAFGLILQRKSTSANAQRFACKW
jgi:hypothetical protein